MPAPDNLKTPDSNEAPDFNAAADVFKLLDDANRLRILRLLSRKELCVVAVAAATKMSCPAVSHHLKLLKTGGLIAGRREGKEVYYKTVRSVRTELILLTIEGLLRIGNNAP